MSLINIDLFIADFFNRLGQIIIYGVIAIIVVVILILLAKYEGGRRILKILGICILYVVGVAVVFAGYYCGNQLYAKMTSQSYINGSMVIENVFRTKTVEYNTNTIEFYTDNNVIYYYIQYLAPVEDYNGLKYNYTLKINDYVLSSEINAGSIQTKFNLDFYGPENVVECSAMMVVQLQFLSDKTKLTLQTYSYTQAQYLKQYVCDNGLRIKVIQGDSI